MSDPILDRLLQLASKRFGVDVSALNPTDDIFDALSIDSLQALELVTDLEGAFGVEVPDYDLQDARTFTDIADVVRDRV
jgi:acyl carrier protein